MTDTETKLRADRSGRVMMRPDRFARVAALPLHYTSAQYQAALYGQLELDIAGGHAAVALLERHLATHSHMTAGDRALYKRRLVAWQGWLGRVEAQRQAAE
jgi:hypothetical protein